MTTDGSTPLACVPGAIPAGDRDGHFSLIRQLFRRVREKVELDDGYVLRFDPAELGDLAQFVENERRCCPFLALSIEQHPDGGALWLRLTGPAGTGPFLEAELSL